ncbi:MAG: FeoB-associated Cys-rich membrane protein [Spartobacteria bacterium]|nr:FeoB-associated Cys-rich membrane protein [Spartobacteria bacterium]
MALGLIPAGWSDAACLGSHDRCLSNRFTRRNRGLTMEMMIIIALVAVAGWSVFRFLHKETKGGSGCTGHCRHCPMQNAAQKKVPMIGSL